MNDVKPFFGRKEWLTIGLGLAGVILGYFLVHVYNDHRDLHKLFDLVNQAQRQQQTTASPQPK